MRDTSKDLDESSMDGLEYEAGEMVNMTEYMTIRPSALLALIAEVKDRRVAAKAPSMLPINASFSKLDYQKVGCLCKLHAEWIEEPSIVLLPSAADLDAFAAEAEVKQRTAMRDAQFELCSTCGHKRSFHLGYDNCYGVRDDGSPCECEGFASYTPAQYEAGTTMFSGARGGGKTDHMRQQADAGRERNPESSTEPGRLARAIIALERPELLDGVYTEQDVQR